MIVLLFEMSKSTTLYYLLFILYKIRGGQMMSYVSQSHDMYINFFFQAVHVAMHIFLLLVFIHFNALLPCYRWGIIYFSQTMFCWMQNAFINKLVSSNLLDFTVLAYALLLVIIIHMLCSNIRFQYNITLYQANNSLSFNLFTDKTIYDLHW